MHGVTVRFSGPRESLLRKPEAFVALDDVTMQVRPGTVMGLVGESGSGKSTMAKVLTGLVHPSDGTLTLGDGPLPLARQRGRKDPSRRLIQMVFQDPFSSLNARHRIGDILSEPLWLYGLEPDSGKRRNLAAAMLDLVGLSADAINRYPHQFSGGQRQRIAVARSLLARPRVLICDEPTSALDVSIQAQVLNLLKDLQSQFGLTILFISHNLAVVRQMSDVITVLKSGKVVEAGASERFFTAPQADYSRTLLALTPGVAA
ncbi:ABC transporter [Antarctobacter heliothermus]|uniref:ABC transporter n=2 Tax=Antarctobacter heliothermus TaxID=74033 RepID=A0A239JRI9_9RHOB|nr:ABC transporter [Antarctobacter heliothermus]